MKYIVPKNDLVFCFYINIIKVIYGGKKCYLIEKKNIKIY